MPVLAGCLVYDHWCFRRQHRHTPLNGRYAVIADLFLRNKFIAVKVPKMPLTISFFLLNNGYFAFSFASDTPLLLENCKIFFSHILRKSSNLLLLAVLWTSVTSNQSENKLSVCNICYHCSSI